MTLPIWQNTQPRVSKQNHYEFPGIRLVREKPRRSKWAFTILVVPVFLLVLAFSSTIVNSHNDSPAPLVHRFAGSGSPLVYITPTNVPVGALGSTFQIRVKVANMAPYVGWDIQVAFDPSVVNATSVSVTGNDFAVNATSGSPFEIVNCVNGAGTGCTSSDHMGVAHSAYGNTQQLPTSTGTGASGLLFTVTFKVVGKVTPWTNITLIQDQISDPNSGNGVSHNTSANALYGSSSGGGGGAGFAHNLDL